MRLCCLLLLAACRPNGPTTDACGTAGSGTVAQLEVGPDAPDGSEPPFTAWHDGDTAKVVIGGQGSTMIVARLRASGPSVPDCMPADVEVTNANGMIINPLSEGLRGYGDASERLTHAIYLPGLYPASAETIHVSATVLGATAQVALVVAH